MNELLPALTLLWIKNPDSDAGAASRGGKWAIAAAGELGPDVPGGPGCSRVGWFVVAVDAVVDAAGACAVAPGGLLEQWVRRRESELVSTVGVARAV